MSRRSAVAVLAIVATLSPCVHAQVTVERGENVDIVGFVAPPRFLVDRLAVANVTILNRLATAEDVVVYVTLHTPDRTADCEGAASKGTITNANRVVTLAPGEERIVVGELPGGQNPWFLHVKSEQAPQPGDYQACAWVERAQQQGTRVIYDFAPSPMFVKTTNAAPTVTVSVTPERGTTSTSFRFGALGRDADGDPLTYRWDFGDGVTAVRDEVEHRFATLGTKTVRVTVSDSFDPANATKTVEVAAGGQTGNPIPAYGVFFATMLFLAVAAAIRRRG